MVPEAATFASSDEVLTKPRVSADELYKTLLKEYEKHEAKNNLTPEQFKMMILEYCYRGGDIKYKS